MSSEYAALQVLLAFFAGWVNRQQQDIIEYLMAENRVLLEQVGDRGVRLNDDQRRRLAIKGKQLGRKLLAKVARIVTPDTIRVGTESCTESSWLPSTTVRRSEVLVVQGPSKRQPIWS